MDGHLLLELVVFLAVAAFAAPLSRTLKLGSILGYLLAGMLIGPHSPFNSLFGIAATQNPEYLNHIAELGIAMFLFLIGLELRPKRLWKMRESVFGAGSVQLIVTGVLLVGLIWELNPRSGLPVVKTLLIGLALALSSTAFALQTLEEKKELTTRHGRLCFSILLFQDLAAIPLIAIVPLFALNAAPGAALSLQGILKALAAVVLIILFGRYVLNRLYRILASTHVREAMTAAALLTVAGVSLLMTEIGLSASLGAFLAGVLLADSAFRHQLKADIEPFESLLLALFFTSIGMTLNIQALLREPGVIAEGVAGMIVVKMLVLYLIGRWQGLDNSSARRLAIVTSQGGEFAFVVFAAAKNGGILTGGYAQTLGIIVTLSMATTPLLMGLDDLWRKWRSRGEPEFDTLPKKDGHVVIAGFGRVGQVVARVLRAKGIPFTALDADAEHLDFVNQFGNKIYYGDATRLSILEAAETHKARAFVLAIDDVESSLQTAQLVKTHFPHVPLFARARNRRHYHQLMDLKVKHIERETFLSSLELTRKVLRGLGLPEGEIRFVTDTFQEHDALRLYEDYAHYTDTQKVAANSQKWSEELAQVFAQDWHVLVAEKALADAEKRSGGKSKTKLTVVDAAAPPVTTSSLDPKAGDADKSQPPQDKDTIRKSG